MSPRPADDLADRLHACGAPPVMSAHGYERPRERRDDRTDVSEALAVVRLKAATPAWMEALAKGDDELTARFGIPVVAGWTGCRRCSSRSRRRRSR